MLLHTLPANRDLQRTDLLLLRIFVFFDTPTYSYTFRIIRITELPDLQDSVFKCGFRASWGVGGDAESDEFGHGGGDGAFEGGGVSEVDVVEEGRSGGEIEDLGYESDLWWGCGLDW